MVTTDKGQPAWLLYLHKILRYLPHAGILSSLAVIAGLVFLNRYSILPFALCLLIPVILVSIYFIWKRPALPDNLHELLSFSNRGFDFNQGIFIKIYGILFCSLVVWLLLTSSRNIVFLIAVFLLYGLSVFQMFLKKFSVNHIIVQLVLTTFLCAVSRIYCYAFFYGGGDAMSLRLSAESILLLGNIDLSMLGAYGYFPLYHITLAILNQICSFSLYDASWLGLDLFTIPLSIFIFLIAKKLTKSDRISVLTLFFYLITPLVFKYLGNIAPRTLSTIAFGIVLYLFLRSTLSKSNKSESWITLLLAGIFTVYMIFAHHAQLILHFGVMAVLVVGYLIYYKRLTHTQIGVLALFYGIPTLYYLYTYITSFLGQFKSLFIDAIAENDITSTAEVTREVFGTSEVVILSAGILMLIAILFGLYYLTHKVSLKSPVIFIWPLALIFFAVYIPNVADAFSMLASMEQIGRLQIVLAPVFSLVIAIGCVVLGHTVYSFRKNPIVGKTAMIVFCLLIVIAAPIISNARDSSFFDYTSLNSESQTFSTPEVNGIYFIGNFIPEQSNIYGDFITSRYFIGSSTLTALLEKPVFEFPRNTVRFFTSDDAELDSNEYLFFRSMKFLNSGLGFKEVVNTGKYTTGVKFTDEAYHYLQRNTYHSNKIYQNPSFEMMSG